MSGIYFKVQADTAKIQQLRLDIERLKTTLSGMKREADPTAYKALENQLIRTQAQFNKLAEKAAISRMELDKTRQKTEQTTREMGSLQSMLLKVGGTAALLSIGKQIIQVRGEFQQLGIAFETMLGSKEKSDKLMQEAIQFAQKTPFTLTDVASNIKQLLAMGIATEGVMQTMKALGDVAAGVSVPISRVAINYGQVATLGKLQQREIRDFAMAGIPLIDELAKNLGRAKNEISDMVEAGKIGFADVERAFQTMAGEGGKFYNLMEKQNKSVTGQISNLQDKVQVMMNSIGQSNEGLIYGGISGLANLVEHYEEVLTAIGSLVAVYGAYKTAIVVVNAYESYLAKNEAIRTSIINAKIASINMAIRAEEAEAAVKASQAVVEANAARITATNEALRQAAIAKTAAAKQSAAVANAELIAAEKAYAATVLETNAAYMAGTLSTNQAANLKKELTVVEAARATASKANANVEKAITSQTVLNARLEAQEVTRSEAEKAAAKRAGIAADREKLISSQTATAAEIRAAKAQSLLNKTMLGNPYVLAAVGLTVLITALMAFRKEAKTTEDLVNDLNDSISQIGKQQDINTLINQYDELKNKQNKSSEEQKTLNNTIQQLSSIFPNAISGIDQYGNAIDLVREKLIAGNAELQKFLENSTRQEINESQKKLNQLIKDRDRLVSEVNTGKKTVTIADPSGFTPTVTSVKDVSESGAKKSTEEIKKLNKEITDLSVKITDTQGKLFGLSSVTADEALRPYQGLFKKVEEYSTKQLYDTKAKLTELLGAGLGLDAEDKIKKQIDAIAAKLGSPTIKKQIEKTIQDITDAENKLLSMRSPGSMSTSTEIEEQEKSAKELKSKLETLTGVKKKETDKQIKEQQTFATKQQELNKQEIDLQFAASQAKVNAMKDGAEKELAQMRLNHEKQLAELEAYRLKYAKDQFEANPDNKGKVFDPKNPGLSEKQETVFSGIKASTKKSQANDEAEFFKKQLKEYETYAQAVKRIEEEFAAERKMVIAAGGTPENIAILNEKEKELLQATATDFAEKSESYEAWLTGIAELSLQTIELELAEARKVLLSEQTKNPGKNTDKTAEYIAKIKVLEDTIQKLTAQKAGDIDNKSSKTTKRTVEEWKDLQDALRDVNDDLQDIGNEIGGLAGEILSTTATVVTTTVGMINGITTLAQWSITATKMAAEGASKAIIAVEQASVILAVIAAAMQIARAIINLVSGESKSEKDTKRLEEISNRIEGTYEAINKQLEKRVELIEEATAAEAKYLDTINQQDIEQQKNYILQQLELLSSTEIFGLKGKNNDLDLQELMDLMGLGNMEEFIKWWNEGTGIRELLAQGYTFTNKESWESIIDSWNDLTDAAEESAEASQEAITGISFDSLKDSLDDLITDVDATFEDIGESLEDNLSKGVLNFVKKTYLNDKMKAWYAQFEEYMSNQGKDENPLTTDEANTLRMLYEEYYKGAQDRYDAAMAAAGIDTSTSSEQEASSRGFQTMSQDTGNALEGRFAVVQMAVVDTAQKMTVVVQNTAGMLGEQMKTNQYLEEQINAFRAIPQIQEIAFEQKMEIPKTTGDPLTSDSAGNKDIFGEIKQIQIASMYHLEDIAKYTKVLPGMDEKLGKMNEKLDSL